MQSVSLSNFKFTFVSYLSLRISQSSIISLEYFCIVVQVYHSMIFCHECAQRRRVCRPIQHTHNVDPSVICPAWQQLMSLSERVQAELVQHVVFVDTDEHRPVNVVCDVSRFFGATHNRLWLWPAYLFTQWRRDWGGQRGTFIPGGILQGTAFWAQRSKKSRGYTYRLKEMLKLAFTCWDLIT